MTKAEIVTEIAKTTGIDKASVLAVVEGLMTSIKDSLAHGENVYLRGFGSFIVKERKEKTARNISKNTTIIQTGRSFQSRNRKSPILRFINFPISLMGKAILMRILFLSGKALIR